jgi:hypothetical protein
MPDSPPLPSDSELTEQAVRMALALHRSVDPDKIRAKDRWTRLRSALVAAAAAAESLGHLVSAATAKLQIEALSVSSQRAIVGDSSTSSEPSVREVVGYDGAPFRRFRYLVERDAIYIAALAQAQRDVERSGADTPIGEDFEDDNRPWKENLAP